MKITSRRIDRLPPYVFAEVNAHKMALRRRGVDIIDLGMGNPDQPTPAHIVDKLTEVVRDPKTHRYASSQGMAPLRSAISLARVSVLGGVETASSSLKSGWNALKCMGTSGPRCSTTH